MPGAGAGVEAVTVSDQGSGGRWRSRVQIALLVVAIVGVVLVFDLLYAMGARGAEAAPLEQGCTLDCGVWVGTEDPPGTGLTTRNDLSPITAGLRFDLTQTGYISGVQYWQASSEQQSDVRVQVRLTNGTLVGDATYTQTPGQSGWHTVYFAAPVSLAAPANLWATRDWRSPGGQFLNGTFQTVTPVGPFSWVTQGTYNGAFCTGYACTPNQGWGGEVFVAPVWQASVATATATATRTATPTSTPAPDGRYEWSQAFVPSMSAFSVYKEGLVNEYANKFLVVHGGYATHIRLFRPADDLSAVSITGRARAVAIFREGNTTAVWSGTIPSTTQIGMWQEYQLPSPPTLLGGVYYRVAVRYLGYDPVPVGPLCAEPYTYGGGVESVGSYQCNWWENNIGADVIYPSVAGGPTGVLGVGNWDVTGWGKARVYGIDLRVGSLQPGTVATSTPVTLTPIPTPTPVPPSAYPTPLATPATTTDIDRNNALRDIAAAIRELPERMAAAFRDILIGDTEQMTLEGAEFQEVWTGKMAGYQTGLDSLRAVQQAQASPDVACEDFPGYSVTLGWLGGASFNVLPAEYAVPALCSIRPVLNGLLYVVSTLAFVRGVRKLLDAVVQ